ncbi:MAG TPA: Cj0069 family protein [Acidimicrobiales bacterium]|nr:Cj0069 family protein [Acidimicrobiales bacterium]
MEGTSREGAARIGLLWQNEPGSSDNASRSPERFAALDEAFCARDVVPEHVLYSADTVEAVREQLLALDGVIVWVNPVEGGANRAPLDQLLREVSSEGVWVSTHPDVILKMGTKEVLYETRTLGWGTDTDLYRSVAELRERFARRLGAEGVRVLKQGRGNGGHGVFRVELLEGAYGGEGSPGTQSRVRVQHASREARVEELALTDFVERCAEYFDWAGFMVDQPYQERLGEGMVRCYLVQDQVAGFCQQWPAGLLPPSAAGARERRRSEMEGAEAPAYQAIRALMESEWLPRLQQVLDLDAESLPVIWDADFLYGPKRASGEDSYVLCEINVSAVWPFPPQAIERLTTAATARLRSARGRR